jgi:hypothetical protein
VDVFVDLSNVAKDTSLGPSDHHASLARWDRLRQAWHMSGRSPATFHLVADASLKSALSPLDVRRLAGWVTSGDVVVCADADAEILRRAVETRGVALSNDRFVDHRRLDGLQAAAQLVGWVARGPDVRLVDRTLTRLQSVLISQRALKQELKALGLREDSPELTYKWACIDRACPEDLVALPLVRGGSPRCPACDSFLDRRDAWNLPVWLKVLFDGDEVTRFVLEDGDVVVVGKTGDPETLDLVEVGVPGEAVALLDEQHALLINEGGSIFVRDLATTRGVQLRLPAAARANVLSPPLPVSSESLTRVPAGAKVILGRTRTTIQIAGSP